MVGSAHLTFNKKNIYYEELNMNSNQQLLPPERQNIPTQGQLSNTYIVNGEADTVNNTRNSELSKVVIGTLIGAGVGAIAGTLAIKGIGEKLNQTIKGVTNVVRNTASGFNNTVKTISESINTVATGVSDTTKDVGDIIKDTAVDVNNTVSTSVSKVRNTVVNVNDTVRDTTDTVKTAAYDVADSVKNAAYSNPETEAASQGNTGADSPEKNDTYTTSVNQDEYI